LNETNCIVTVAIKISKYIKLAAPATAPNTPEIGVIVKSTNQIDAPLYAGSDEMILHMAKNIGMVMNIEDNDPRGLTPSF